MQFQYSLRWIHKIAEIPKTAWDALAMPLKTPFLEWNWLHNLERSGSATTATGWQPAHLTIWRKKDLIAAAPMYVKGHSYGEFVFDQQWADLSYRLGLQYYPKLLGMSPFTPAVGYRFLIAPGEDEAAITEMMIKAIDKFCLQHQLSGSNFLFVDPEWRKQMEGQGYTSWLHHSYIWQNKGFNSFDDYLAQFNANQRRNIKRERKSVLQAGLSVKVRQGEEIQPSFFGKIYDFYSSTCDKFYWGSKYLNKQFFENLQSDYAHRVVLVTAHTGEDVNSDPIALSFCLRKDENLYGRYWGALQEYDALHFEACYYQPIEWGLSQGITMFDPGAGGSHKRRRGFPARENHSLHRFYDTKMTSILRHYIGQINAAEEEEIEAINQDLPFSKREIDLNC